MAYPGSAVSSQPQQGAAYGRARSDLRSSDGCRVQRHLTWQHPSPPRPLHLDPCAEAIAHGAASSGADALPPTHQSTAASVHVNDRTAVVSRYATNPIPSQHMPSVVGGGVTAAATASDQDPQHPGGTTAPLTVSSVRSGSSGGSGSSGRLFAHRASKSSASGGVSLSASEDDTINCKSQHKKGESVGVGLGMSSELLGV